MYEPRYQALSKACARSAIISSICSIPTDSLTVDSVICCSASSSALICECVVVAGCITRLLTSATFARSEKISRLSINRHAAS